MSVRPGSAERPPLIVMALAIVAVMFFVLPLAGLLVRTGWNGLSRELASAEVRDALRLSVLCSLAATALSTVFGVPLAWVLARVPFPGRRFVRALITLPMVLPPVVGGVALLLVFGRRGLIGHWLDHAFGFSLPFTPAGVVIAEAFVAMPFLIVAVEAAFRSTDRRLEEAARTLGSGQGAVFRRVTLPLAWPSLLAGVTLCWARALGEFGATITFAGSFPGQTQTTPLKVYLLLETRPQAAIALSLVLVFICIGVLVSLRDRWLK
jgi:molybdate transport system permease protein